MLSSSDSDSSRKCCLPFLPVGKCYFMLQLNLRIHPGGKLGTDLTNLTHVFKKRSFVFVSLFATTRQSRQYHLFGIPTGMKCRQEPERRKPAWHSCDIWIKQPQTVKRSTPARLLEASVLRDYWHAYIHTSAVCFSEKQTLPRVQKIISNLYEGIQASYWYLSHMACASYSRATCSMKLSGIQKKNVFLKSFIYFFLENTIFRAYLYWT